MAPVDPPETLNASFTCDIVDCSRFFPSAVAVGRAMLFGKQFPIYPDTHEPESKKN